MAGIASLPMYDHPELRASNNRLWQFIQRQLPDAPKSLSRPDDLWALWRAPDLVLAQTCGLPFRHSLHETVTLIGTPDYGLDGCPPGYYHSVILARRDAPSADLKAFAGACLAFNDPLSQSGWAAPSALAKEQGIEFGGFLETGAHDASALAVAEGRADLAALDAHSWRLLQRYAPWTDTLTVIDKTPPTPGLPLITAQTALAEQITQAVEHAIAGLTEDDRSTLALRGLARIPKETYLVQDIPAPPQRHLWHN